MDIWGFSLPFVTGGLPGHGSSLIGDNVAVAIFSFNVSLNGGFFSFCSVYTKSLGENLHALRKAAAAYFDTLKKH